MKAEQLKKMEEGNIAKNTDLTIPVPAGVDPNYYVALALMDILTKFQEIFICETQSCANARMIDLKYDSEMVMDGIKIIAVCPSCAKETFLENSSSLDLITSAMVLVIHKRLFYKLGVAIPCFRDILQWVKDGLWLHFCINCEHCGFKEYQLLRKDGLERN